MTQEFLMELSEDQQELISGGGQPNQLTKYKQAFYENLDIMQTDDLSAGPDGARIRENKMIDFDFSDATLFERDRFFPQAFKPLPPNLTATS